MGLIRWYQFNGDNNDYSGNAKNLQGVSGITSNDNGKIGKCALFSSGQGYTPNPILGRNIFSICFWAKPDSPSAWSDIFTCETSKFRLEKTDSDTYQFYADVASGSPVSGVALSSLPNATWTHVAIVLDGSKFTTYKNGVVDKTGSLTGNLVSGANFYIGSRIGSSYWKGYLNDFRIYDHALSLKEVREIAKAKMIHYTCNVSANSKVRDSSGFRYHASLASGASPTLTSADSGTGSSSFLFVNGSKQSNGLYQHFISDTTIRIPDQGTLSYWIKYSGTENSDNKYAVGFANFCSINNSGALGMIYYKDASNYTTTAANQSLRDSKWHMHTISWDKSTKAFKNYLDGTLLQSATVTDFTHAGTFRQFIVGSAWTTSYGGHSGYLDDIRVYATVLSDADVKDLYQTKASISKNGKMFANEICETTLANMTTKTAYDANWVRIFYHNNNSGAQVFSSDEKEFLRCNTTYKKSDLWALEHFRNKDGQFEFLLEYEGQTGYNRWKQTSDFTKTTSITGYSAVQVSWTSNGWGGLALSQDSGSTWVDGSPNSGASSWWYAIGCKTNYNSGIPGPNGAIASAGLSLWVRTDNLPAVNITKKGIVFANEICEVDNTSMKTKTELSANWVRLFYHNNVGGTVLFSDDKNEFLKCNDGGNKISDLWALEQFRGKDGKFEFLLQYQSGGTSYNRWKQSSNFTKEAIAGYEAVQVSWTASYWGGLEYDGTANTWVTGSVNHSNWYYAIGAKLKYKEGIPSFQEYEAGWVEIWVRCDDINLFRMIKNGKCKATEFIEI